MFQKFHIEKEKKEKRKHFQNFFGKNFFLIEKVKKLHFLLIFCILFDFRARGDARMVTNRRASFKIMSHTLSSIERTLS